MVSFDPLIYHQEKRKFLYWQAFDSGIEA